MVSEVYNIDCMDYMRNLPDKHFDLVIADPPYGISIDRTGLCEGLGLSKQNNTRARLRKERFCGRVKLKDRAMCRLNTEWDLKPPTKEFFDELFRVSYNQIIWGGNYFELPPTRGIVCWDKEQTFLNFSAWEMAWTSFDVPAKIFRFSNRGFLSPEAKDKADKVHPTQKPIALYGWLLKNFAEQGQTIFDPMMGSQSSRIAAYRMGFDYYGCELDSEYFRTGSERFERICMGAAKKTENYTIVQTKLF